MSTEQEKQSQEQPGGSSGIVDGYVGNIEPIRVWPFHDAPQKLRNLSTNGGDEDWIAVIPPNFSGRYINWAEAGGAFGCCCVDEYDHPTRSGYKVRIGSHA